jgi:hypothetical protein
MHYRTRLRGRILKKAACLSAAVTAFGAVGLGAATTSTASAAEQGPTGSHAGQVGWDAFRHLDALPLLAPDAHTKQFSSFDRTGGNDDGFGGRYSCLRTSANGCVIAEASGAGEISSIWFTRDGGDVTKTGNITIELDGRTVLDAPLQDVVDGKLGAPFVHPLVSNADQNSGGVAIKVPMPYRESMKVTTDNNPLFYHVTYRTFDDAQGVQTFDPDDPATDVLAKLRNAGQQDPKSQVANARTAHQKLSLEPGQASTLATLDGAGAVRALRLRIPQVVGPTGQDIHDDGRAFGQDGYSEFTVKIDPDNEGVVLTRRHETHIGNQHADIYVDGQLAAEWPASKGTSASQWADQTVTIPKEFTAGKSEITIRNSFVSSDLDFNEFHYWVDSVVDADRVRTDSVDVGPEHLANEQAHGYTITHQTWQGAPTLSYPPTPEEQKAVVASDDILAHTRLQISFDGHRTVDAPLGEFFGSGLGEYPVHSLFFAMDPDGWYSAWWPMPFAEDATVRLVNNSGQAIDDITAEVTWAPDPSWASALAPHGTAGYFTARAAEGDTEPGKDWVFADVSGRGKFVGVSDTMRGEITSGNTRAYLEGDERVYVDGSDSPALHGTGTEDFYESGWYFNRGTYSGLFTGNAGHEVSAYGCDHECDSAYRLMITDAVPYRSAVRFSIEHGPGDDAPAVYSSTAFMYTQPRFGLQRTDSVDIGNAASEKAHDFQETGSSTPWQLSSTYEGDFDDAVVSDEGRDESQPFSFTVSLDKENRGAVIRRTSDQSHPYQRARVLVDGQPAGTWLQPLGNGHSRWLQDEFGLPASLTAGKTSVRVTLVPSVDGPAWSAARYDVLSKVRPFADHQAPTQVTDLTARGGADNSIQLSWSPSEDGSGIAAYRVYGSRDAGFGIGPATYLGSTKSPGFVHRDGLRTTWHYRVVAVDLAGNTSTPSEEVAATTGDTLRVEAESMLPAVSSTAPVEAQGNCCGVTWSNNAQLWFRADSPGDTATLSFDVPQSGTYDISAVLTKARDYGILSMSLDGTALGDSFNGYHAPEVVKTDPVALGERQLSAGSHTLTLTVTGKDDASVGYLAGIDVLDLTLQ